MKTLIYQGLVIVAAGIIGWTLPIIFARILFYYVKKDRQKLIDQHELDDKLLDEI